MCQLKHLYGKTVESRVKLVVREETNGERPIRAAAVNVVVNEVVYRSATINHSSLKVKLSLYSFNSDSLTPLESNEPGLELNFTVLRRARSFLSTLQRGETK